MGVSFNGEQAQTAIKPLPYKGIIMIYFYKGFQTGDDIRLLVDNDPMSNPNSMDTKRADVIKQKIFAIVSADDLTERMIYGENSEYQLKESDLLVKSSVTGSWFLATEQKIEVGV